MSYRRRLIIFGLLALLLLGAGLFLQYRQEHKSLQHEELVLRAEKSLAGLCSKLDTTLNRLLPELEGFRFNERAFSFELADKELPAESGVMVYEDGRLRYWSDTRVLPDSSLAASMPNGKVALLGNGWYYVSKRQAGNRTLLGMLLIQHQYVLQNKYLDNSFHPQLGLSQEVRIAIDPDSNGYIIRDRNKQALFSISFPAGEDETQYPFFISLLYGAAIGLGFLLSLDALRRFGREKSLAGYLLLGGIIILRFFMAKYHWPVALYESELFSSKYYASGFLFNSLGDLLLSVSTASLIILFVFTRLLNSKIAEEDWKSRVLIVTVFFLTFIFSVVINYLLSGLITNSQISFDINNIFQLSAYTGIGMVVIGLLLSTFYLLCDGSIQFIRKTGLKFSLVAILFLISQGLFLITLLFFRRTDLFMDYGVSAFLLANVLILFTGYIRGSELQLYSFSRTVMVILVFSLYAAQIIFTFNEARERDKRQLLAAKLENEQDIVAEFLLQNVEIKIRNDRELIRLLTASPQAVMNSPTLIDDVSRHLTRQFFTGYLGRYEVHFKYFNTADLPINRAGDPSWNLDIIRKRNLEEGRPSSSEDFYYFRGENGHAEYIGIIRPGANDSPAGTVVVELSARSSQDENGFPELLLSDKVGSNRDLIKYSYARYQQGSLVNQSGSYSYYLTDGPYMQYFRNLDGMRFVTFDNYKHLFYRYGRNLIIISTPQQGVWVWVTLFSYLFTFFSFSYLIMRFAIRFIREGFYLKLNFNSRIQLTIIMIVIGTLILIGVATVTYIVDNYQQAQTNRIRERLNNIRVLVESELSNRESLGESISDDLQYTFSRLAATLKSDFNLYTPSGRLYFSSQPGIYDQDIIAPLMNRIALTSLTTNQKAIFVQNENIGKLRYGAAYEPVSNSNNKGIGFLSLPYFDRDTELKRDISSFLVALINLYVLLFSVSILIAFFISNRITQPLRIIQENLRKTKLGSTNEPIVWKTNDEIGDLIREYNRMVAQLQTSAELLAKSERESAWREMAKQVAHEIKNPLTPMKLGIQHLQRAMDDGHPNKEELVKRISNTLIEQIETLSNIATEFSHFAKMPGPKYTEVDLIGVLEHSCDLYSEVENTTLRFNEHPSKVLVKADKDQLIRIFGNLIKNSIQAIPDNRKGEININISDREHEVIISVSDNGIGIPKDQLNKIFVPNFTTKSSGTGLGLAMVRTMIEGMGGNVWFETTENAGTTFFVKLLKM